MSSHLYGFLIGLGILVIPYISHADISTDPNNPVPQEYDPDITVEVPELTDPISARTPLPISYSLSYSEHFLKDSDYTPEDKDALLASTLEDMTTYLEVWKGTPFSSDARLIETRRVSRDRTGTTTLSSLEPGTYFLAYIVSQEIRDKDAYCLKYSVPTTDCHEPGYFIEFPIGETETYFTRTETEQPSFEARPTAFGLLPFQVTNSIGASNVLFLPGIKGSRLYDGADTKLWEPFGNHDIEDLFLSERGESIRTDIHTQSGDIIDTVALTTDVYSSFTQFMDGLVANDTIQAWRAIPYDWRLSLPTIVSGLTGTPLHTALETLAQTSKTGKVTIVAHSNGGLVAKVLLQSLGTSEASRLIDDIIFIGVPQSGAPQALLALLYGYKEGLPWWFPGIVSTRTARQFALNAPMGYHLLPSSRYFSESVSHPVASFTGTSFESEQRAYGTNIDSVEELARFARAEEGGRTAPHEGDVWSAALLNSLLLSYAENIHASIDAWTPPLGITLHQLAGWGVATVDGIAYTDLCILDRCVPSYHPTFTHEGDGVVPTVSALMTSASSVIHRYWINLEKSNDASFGTKDHGTLLSLPQVHEFVEDTLLHTKETLPEYITDIPPIQESRKRFLFFLHSPLTIEVCTYDSCVSESTSTIQGASYGRIGEMQYVVVPGNNSYTATLDGYATGTFSLEVLETESDQPLHTKTFVSLPVTPDTIATLSIENTVENVETLVLDTNGDGTADAKITPTEQERNLRTKKKKSVRLLPIEISSFVEALSATVHQTIPVPAVLRQAHRDTSSSSDTMQSMESVMETEHLGLVQRFLMILERILQMLQSLLTL